MATKIFYELQVRALEAELMEEMQVAAGEDWELVTTFNATDDAEAEVDAYCFGLRPGRNYRLVRVERTEYVTTNLYP